MLKSAISSAPPANAATQAYCPVRPGSAETTVSEDTPSASSDTRNPPDPSVMVFLPTFCHDKEVESL